MYKDVTPTPVAHSPLDVFVVFLKLGLTSFGGPIAHLGYFHRELVQKRGWVSESQYAQLLALCQFLPGPASSQLGFVLGLLRAGWRGALAAFAGFSLPSVMLMLGFAALLPYLSGAIDLAIIHGLKLVACAVVADAVLGMWRKLCSDWIRRLLAVAATVLVLWGGSAVWQLLAVALAAVVGGQFCRGSPALQTAVVAPAYGRKAGGILLSLFVMLLVGLSLVAALSSEVGGVAVADAFYRAGALVFGGGHVVLPLLQESVVESGWVSDADFLAGYGAAQALPGPLFAFSAYLGSLIPAGPGAGATAAIALVFMFLPGFLLVAAVLPLWHQVASGQRLSGAVAGVNAAVVGLLAAALYNPIFTSGVADWSDLLIALVGFALLAVWRLSPLWVVGWCVTATVLRTVIF